MENVQGLLKNRDAATVNLWEDGLVIVDDWRRRFPEEIFPVQEFRQYAEDNNLRPGDAYKQFIAPRIEKVTEAAHEKALVLAREEGAKEALSKHNLPTDPTPRDPSPFFAKPELDEEGKPAAPMGDVAKRNLFMEGLRPEAGAE